MDGVEYNDNLVTARQTDGAGPQGALSPKLGQRVRAHYNAASRTSTAGVQSIEVMPQLIGPVSSATDVNGWTQVMGQWEQVVKTGGDIRLSGPTVTSGYRNAEAIAQGDDVQVHGAWTYDASKSADVLVATLVDTQATPADPVQLGGAMTALGSPRFRLKADTSAAVQANELPQGLSNGQVVQVWAAVKAPTGGPTATILTANRVTANTLIATEVASLKRRSISGLATAYDPTTRTVQVQSIRIQIATNASVDASALSRGEFVSLQINSSAAVRGPVNTTTGTTSGNGAVTDLKSCDSGINWKVSNVRFTLRDTAIEAGCMVIASSCKASV